MRFEVEVDREDDGRWIAEVPSIPGAMCYGATRAQAVQNVEGLALRVLGDQLQQGEFKMSDDGIQFREVAAE